MAATQIYPQTSAAPRQTIPNPVLNGGVASSTQTNNANTVTGLQNSIDATINSILNSNNTGSYTAPPLPKSALGLPLPNDPNAAVRQYYQDTVNSAVNNIKAGNFGYTNQQAKELQNPKALSENYSSLINSDAYGRPLTGAGNEFIAPLGSKANTYLARPDYSSADYGNSAKTYGLSTGQTLGAINPETAYGQQAKDLTAQRSTKGRSSQANVAKSFSTGMGPSSSNSGMNTNKYLKNILNSIGA